MTQYKRMLVTTTGVVRRQSAVAIALAGCAFLAGCQLQPTEVSSSVISTQGFHGTVHGGQQPVTGASIQLYTVGTTGDGSAATSLLNAPVTTDSGGNFQLTGDFTCPSPDALTYIVASGGNPGLAQGVNNSAATIMAALGRCDGLTPTRYLVLNEITTVAAVAALAPYMNSASTLGSGASDAASLAAAFTFAQQLANTANGTSPGVNIPTGYTAPVALIDTLANIVSACINSGGGTAGDGSACGTFFALTAGSSYPTDTIAGLINLAHNPTYNAGNLYNIVPAIAPFQPLLSSAPSSFSIQLTSTSVPSTTTTAILAVGLQNVVPGYTGPAMRIQRLSDNAQTDIYFTSAGNVDASAVLSFLGSSSNLGYIVALYDQTGNGNHVTQTAVANAPTISLSSPTTITVGSTTYLTARSVISSTATESPVAGPGYWNFPAGLSVNTAGTTAILAYEPDFSAGEGFEEFNFGNSDSVTFNLIRGSEGFYGDIANGTAWLPFGSGDFARQQPTVVALATDSNGAPTLYIDGTPYSGVGSAGQNALLGGTLLGGPSTADISFENFLSFQLFPSTLSASTIASASSSLIPRSVPSVNIVADGDSITEGHCATYGRAALRYAEPNLKVPVDLTNIARGGSTSVDRIFNISFPSISSSPVGRLYNSSYGTNIYYLAIGTNDIHVNGSSGAVTWATVQAMLLDAKLLGYKTAVATIIHETYETASQAAEVNSYNNALRAAVGGGLVDVVVDYDANSQLQAPNFFNNSCDGTHPNDSGYAIMGNVAYPALNSLIP